MGRAGLLFMIALGLVNSSPAAGLTVVVDVAPHRHLTEELHASIKQQLRAGLDAALTGIDDVSVIDARQQTDQVSHLFKDFAWRDLARLDQWQNAQRGKTHIVLIDFDSGRYRIRSRQFDGGIGWASPLVRDDTTVDRELVGRIALDQVLRDYGLTARVTASDADRTATCRISSVNASDDQLRKWVRPGDVWAVVRESRSGRGFAVPHTYLIVAKEPTGGQMECRIESRFVKPLAGWEAGAFAIVKLGTSIGPARLRAISTSGVALPELKVSLSATGLDKTDAVREQGVMRYGRFVSQEKYDRLGFARLVLGDRVAAQVPVPILDHEPTVVEVNTDPAGEATALADSDLRHLNNRLRDLMARANQDHDQLKKLLHERKNRQALGLLIITLRRFDDELPIIAGEVAAWRSKATPATKSTIDDLARQIRDLQVNEQSLRKTKANLEESLGGGGQEAMDAMRALLAKAERDEHDADYDAVITAYEQALQQNGDWPDLARKLDELKKQWIIKSDAHRAARKFIYETWARTQSIEDIEKNLDGVRRAFDICKQVDDRLSPRKIYLVLRRSIDILVRRDDELRKSETEEAAQQMESLRKLRTSLLNLMNDVENYARKQQ